MDRNLRSELAHVLWLGGGARTGKTTISRQLAGKYDLKLYNLDWHQVREHRQRFDPVRHPTAVAWEEATMDERWVAPTVEDLTDGAIRSWTEGFDLVLEDLLLLPRDRVVLAEGPGAFPWCVAPVLSSPDQALFLVPTPEFRDAVYARRMAGQVPFDNTSDPARAAQNLRGRDIALAVKVVESCRELGLKHLEMDGSLDLEAAVGIAENQFRRLLPAALNV